MDHTGTELDVALRNGKLAMDAYCSWEQRGDWTEKEDGRLGWKYRFYDRKGKEIPAERFFQIRFQEHFQGLEERTAQFGWFQTIDEEAYEEDFSEVKQLSDEELLEKMKISYQTFGFTEKRKSAAEQLAVLAACRKQRLPWENGEATGLEPEAYSFLVSDLDDNGLLEVLVSVTSGSGNVSRTQYYEVNDTEDGLVDITPEEETEIDWLGGSSDYREPLMTLYEEYTGNSYITHYAVANYVWGGNGNGESISLDVYLRNQKLHVVEYAAEVLKRGKSTYYRIEEGEREAVSKKVYKRRQKTYFKKLGELVAKDDWGRIFYWFSLSEDMSEKRITEALENAYMNWMYNGDERYE